MLWLIATLGGLLIMMGHHSRSEAVFYYFRLEDQVPENHLLRLIDQQGKRATELRRLERSQSCLCLNWQREALWSVLPKSAMHEWTV